MYCRSIFEYSLPLLPRFSRAASRGNSPSPHLYQNTYTISPLVSHTSTCPHSQPLSFDIHPQNTRGWVCYPSGQHYPPQPEFFRTDHSAANCELSTVDCEPTLTPLLATHTNHPSRKPFRCHSYEKHRGGVPRPKTELKTQRQCSFLRLLRPKLIPYNGQLKTGRIPQFLFCTVGQLSRSYPNRKILLCALYLLVLCSCSLRLRSLPAAVLFPVPRRRLRRRILRPHLRAPLPSR